MEKDRSDVIGQIASVDEIQARAKRDGIIRGVREQSVVVDEVYRPREQTGVSNQDMDGRVRSSAGSRGVKKVRGQLEFHSTTVDTELELMNNRWCK
jgi:hypothetical protein